MRILIAPDKFKGCLSSREAAAAIAEGTRRAAPLADIDVCPIADGGEGTVAALVDATAGQLLTRTVTGPRTDMRANATFGLLGDGRTAVIEMAEASGLHLLSVADRNPMQTTTFGTGELIVEAMKLGARRIIVGIGGSATVDAGLGCIQACGGLPVLNNSPLPISRPFVGSDLQHFDRLEWDDRLTPFRPFEILVACDVTSPLAGPLGAAKVFGPQKAATAEQVEQLDIWLTSLGQRTGDGGIANAPGAGAAGGLGFGLMAFLGARLEPGFDLISQAVGLPERVRRADLVLTGEGRLDASSLYGKTAIGVARLCANAGVPCIALAGAIADGAANAARVEGLTAAFSICEGPMELEQAVKDSRRLLADLAGNVTSLIVAAIGRRSDPTGRDSAGLVE